MNPRIPDTLTVSSNTPANEQEGCNDHSLYLQLNRGWPRGVNLSAMLLSVTIECCMRSTDARASSTVRSGRGIRSRCRYESRSAFRREAAVGIDRPCFGSESIWHQGTRRRELFQESSNLLHPSSFCRYGRKPLLPFRLSCLLPRRKRHVQISQDDAQKPKSIRKPGKPSHSDTSRPFAKPSSGRIAVKVMKVFRV